MIDAKYCTSVGEGSIGRVSSLISTAFSGPVKDCEEWVRSQGLTDLRTVERASDARVDACLRRIEMGQYFGGRSVPMVGIAGVAVAPESRGRGLARWMMRRSLEEMYEKGEALSTLYASTQTLYRQVGYEQAGYRVAFTLPLSEIDCRERGDGGGNWTAVDFGGVERLMSCYRTYASRFNGTLDRGPYVWKRTFDWRDRKATAYAHLNRQGEVEAYATVAQKRKENGRVAIELTDMAFLDGASGRRLLGMLHDFASMADEVTFFSAPHHPIHMLLGQQRAVGTFREYWMLRLVRVADSLRLRGYHPGVTAEVHLHITDSTLPGNGGPLVLRVRDGVGEVSPGGRGEVRVSVQALAALYSGFASITTLQLAEMIEGPSAALASAGLAFSGSAPWMPDFF